MRNEADDGRSVSCWAAGGLPVASPLLHDADADVCVIGAGIAGLTTAYLAALDGASVLVMDDGPIAGGQTHRTTGHLASAIDDRFQEIERLHGREALQLAAQSHAVAIDRIEAIVAREAIDCDFERLDGYLWLAPGQPREWLERELAAAQRAALDGVELVERTPVEALGPALRFPGQAQIDAVRYAAGLAAAATRAGARIHTDTHAAAIETSRGLRVRTSRDSRVTARSVVVATNAPIHLRVAIHTKQVGHRSYVSALRVASGRVPRALYWDTQDPYHYVRLARDPQSADGSTELLLVGGEDHRIGGVRESHAIARHERLERFARSRFGVDGDAAFRWSGEVMEPVDGLAFIGRSPGGPRELFLATGDSGMGLTHGTIAGMLIADALAGRENRWARLYDPSRKTLRATGEFLRDAVETAKCYGEWLRPSRAEVEALKPGCGAIVGRGRGKRAVYRDDDGTLHALSPVCTHLGGQVEWNEAEKTWDCGCHGSRFDRRGRVLHGPANDDLAKQPMPS